MGGDTKDVIDKLFNTLLQRFQSAQETSNERGSESISDSVELLYYHFQRIDIRKAELCIISPDWIVSKVATINPKNEKDNECFKWSIISGLHYDKINEKYLKKQIFHHTKETGKKLNKKMIQQLLASYLYDTSVKR